MSQEVISYFGFSCPFGGQFYVCEGNSTEFLGCCNSNPCLNEGVCPDDDLRVATFNKDRYEDLPREDCAPGSDALWYTCSFNNPPFMGCCLSNPCATGEGCAAADLGPAFLAPEGAKDENRRTPLISPPKATTAPTAKSTTPATTTSSPTGTVTGVSIAETQRNSDHSLSTGAIVGIVLGCCAVIVVLVAILFYKCGSKRAKKDESENQPVMQFAQRRQQYNGDYHAVPSPYSDSYNSATTAVGRYSNESYAKAKLSPGTPNFQQPYSDESHEYPAQVAAVAGRHAAYRQYPGHGHGLGIPMEAVQELDSTAVTVELSADLPSEPKELGGMAPAETGMAGYAEGSSAGYAGSYGQDIGTGQNISGGYGQDTGGVLSSSGGAYPHAEYGYQTTGREDNTPGDLVSAVSYTHGTISTNETSTFGRSGAPIHGSPGLGGQSDWQESQASGDGRDGRPTLRRVPRRPLGSPRPPSPSTTPGPTAVGEPF